MSPNPPAIQGLTRESRNRYLPQKSSCRLALIRSQLDITHTIATFGDPRKDSLRLLEARRPAARKGCELATRLLLECGPLDESHKVLDTKLTRTRAELANLENGLPCAAEAPWPGLTPVLHRDLQIHSAARNKGGDNLTSRETEVIRQVALGKTCKEIAAWLGITFKTAACHRYRAMDKLGIHDTATLVRYAFRVGLLRA